MVHHQNNCYGLTDCTAGGTYHNRFFRDAAILAGLVCFECDKYFGYGHTELGDRARWAIGRLKPKVTLFRMAETKSDAPRRSNQATSVFPKAKTREEA
jgi:hypothetical protein